MTIYPVVIPTLCRFTHFSSCVESLAACYLADQTELVIGLDFPSHESHYEGYYKILNYLDTIKGFRKVTILKTSENLGTRKNLDRLINYVFESYDAYIFTEDDNIFSPCFLQYINLALEKYRDDVNIMSVSGYTPIPFTNITQKQMILTYDSSAWGYATWRNKRELYSSIPSTYYRDVLKSFKKSIRILRVYPSSFGMLLQMTKRGVIYGDVQQTIYNIINNTYQLRPSFSLVRNIGQDGSGLHSGVNDIIQNQPISKSERFTLEETFFTKNFVRKINAVTYKMGFPQGLYNRVKYIMSILYSWIKYCLSNS